MYTIISLTHIVEEDKLQALIKFPYKGKDELTVTVVSVSDVGRDLATVYTNQTFIDSCNAAITKLQVLIDNPIIP